MRQWKGMQDIVCFLVHLTREWWETECLKNWSVLNMKYSKNKTRQGEKEINNSRKMPGGLKGQIQTTMKKRDTEIMWQTLQSRQQYYAFKNHWQRTYIRGMIRKHNIWVEAGKHVKVSGVFWVIVLCKYESTKIPWFSPATAGTAAAGLGTHKDQLHLLIRASLLLNTALPQAAPWQNYTAPESGTAQLTAPQSFPQESSDLNHCL